MENEKVIVPLSRFLLAGVFIGAGVSKFTQREGTERYIRSRNLPFAPLLRIGAGLIEVAGGLSLLLGVRGRYSAGLLAGYLVPTTFLFHDFWNANGEDKQALLDDFLKNLSIIGGLLSVIAHGSGPLSIDQRYLGENPLEPPEPIDYFEIEDEDITREPAA